MSNKLFDDSPLLYRPRSSSSDSNDTLRPLEDPKAWEIIHRFATDHDMSLPAAEDQLKLLLGTRFMHSEWQLALNAVMDAEEDTDSALAAIKRLQDQVKPKPTAGVATRADLPQLDRLEAGLMEAVADLKARKRITGTPPTLEELVNPVEENEIGESEYSFPGGDDEIIAAALEATKQSDDVAENQDESDDEDPSPADCVSPREGLDLCEKMEKLVLSHADADGVDLLGFQRQLRKMRGHLRQLENSSYKQATLDSFFTSRSSNVPMEID